MPWLLLSHAEQRISSSLAGLLVAAVPLLGAVVYRLAGVAERLDARRLAGLVIGFGGVAALVGIDVGDSDPLAMAEVIVVALCYAIGPLIISRRLRGLPNLAVVAASLVITAAIYTPPGLLDLPGSVSAETVAAVVTLALVCTVLGFAVFFALIHEVGPARATVITYVNPLVAVLLGVVLMGEPFTAGIAVGLPLILLGSVLGTAPPLKTAAEGAAMLPGMKGARDLSERRGSRAALTTTDAGAAMPQANCRPSSVDVSLTVEAASGLSAHDQRRGGREDTERPNGDADVAERAGARHLTGHVVTRGQPRQLLLEPLSDLLVARYLHGELSSGDIHHRREGLRRAHHLLVHPDAADGALHVEGVVAGRRRDQERPVLARSPRPQGHHRTPARGAASSPGRRTRWSR